MDRCCAKPLRPHVAHFVVYQICPWNVYGFKAQLSTLSKRSDLRCASKLIDLLPVGCNAVQVMPSATARPESAGRGLLKPLPRVDR